MKPGTLPISFLTKTEQKKVLVRAHKNKENGRRDFVLIFLAMNTGLRLDEIVNLDISDINIRNDTVNVRYGKGGKTREAYLTDEARDVMASYIKEVRLGPFHYGDGQPLFLNQKGKKSYQRISRAATESMVTRVFRACNIREGSIHRLRHTFAVNALEAGMSIVEIQTLLGHDNVATTVKYLKLDNKWILEKVKKNFPLAFISIKNIPELMNGPKSNNINKLIKQVDKNDRS